MRSILALTALLAFAGAAQAADPVFPSSAGNLTVDTVAGGLVHPWSLAFLPDGRMLVTERPGRMRIVTRDGKLSPPLAGVPPVFARGQAGLLDVVLDRDFAQNRTIYFCYAEPFDGGGRIAVARAQLEAGGTPRLPIVTVIFRQHGPAVARRHLGCRIVQGADGNLFVTLGDHFTDRDMAQTLDNRLGKIVRITPDGAAPKDNPFVGKAGARPEIWSLRASQSARPRLQSRRRQIVGAGARPEGRRRDQHHRAGPQLRLAGGQLWRQLRRHAGRHRQVRKGRHGSIRSGTGRRRSRRPAWRSIPAICSRAGKAA